MNLNHRCLLSTGPVSSVKKLLPCLAYCLFVLSDPVAAQADDTRWYQIEIILFGQPEAFTNERWTPDIELRYPANWRVLKDPEQAIKAIEARMAESTNSEQSDNWQHSTEDLYDGIMAFPAASISTPADTLHSSVMNEDPVSADYPPSFETDTSNPPSAALETDTAPKAYTPDQGLIQDSPPADEYLPDASLGAEGGFTAEDDYEKLTASSLVDLETLPFYLLPEEERQLNEQARSLRLSADYRLLKHIAWRQPFPENSESQHILLSAGNPFGKHHELEGTISITLSRYLHLNTNLWLSRFKHNFGQTENSEWPSLPLRPDLRIEAMTAGEEDALWNLTDTTVEESIRDILTTPYVPTEVILIQQHRRMRSGEVHYLDHPRIGMIILCSPYELPEPESSEDTPEAEAITSGQ